MHPLFLFDAWTDIRDPQPSCGVFSSARRLPLMPAELSMRVAT